ncbi:MAG: flavoprotein [Planctomycetota bacterium]
MAKILLGVTGSIAAYKAAALTSQLQQRGHDVTAILTRAATELIGPATFLGLTGNRVYTNLWESEQQTEHIALTDAAELFVVAPATANCLAKLAHGIADDMLTTTALAVRCPKLVAPAMNTRMWEHPATQANLERLRDVGYGVVPPGAGSLACGHVGAGRLAEVETLLAAVEAQLALPPATASAGLFLEVVRYPTPPDAAAEEQERAFRAAALAAGTLVASGPLVGDRRGHLHRAPSLEAARARAAASPLAAGAEVEVLPWSAAATP